MTGGGSGTINLASGSALDYQSSATSTFSGSIAGPGQLQVGVNTSTIVGTLALGGADGYRAGTLLGAGTLSVSADAALGTAPASAATNITFSGNATLETVSSFSLNANRDIVLDPNVVATFDTYGSATYTTIPGVIGPDGGIVKAGMGSLELDGLNSYTDSTAIDAGTVVCGSNLALGGAGYTGGGEVPITINGTLDLNGQNKTFLLGDGTVRTGVMVGDLYGDGAVKDNSAGGGGFLDVDLTDNGRLPDFDTFSGSFGGSGQLPSVSIDVGGFPGFFPINGPSTPAAPDTLTLDGPVWTSRSLTKETTIFPARLSWAIRRTMPSICRCRN